MSIFCCIRPHPASPLEVIVNTPSSHVRSPGSCCITPTEQLLLAFDDLRSDAGAETIKTLPDFATNETLSPLESSTNSKPEEQFVDSSRHKNELEVQSLSTKFSENTIYEVYPGIFILVGKQSSGTSISYLNGNFSSNGNFDSVVDSGGNTVTFHDMETEQDFGQLLRTVDTIRECLHRHESVLIQGSNSIFVAVALIIAEHDGLGTEDAVTYIRSRINYLDTKHFKEQLAQVYIKLKYRPGRKPHSAARQFRKVERQFMSKSLEKSRNPLKQIKLNKVNENGSPILRVLGQARAVLLSAGKSAQKKTPGKEN